MDANENPFNLFGEYAEGIDINRYPDGANPVLRKELASLFNLEGQNLAVGNGSDELIDLLIRIFCRPGKDKIMICPPTFGMYRVAADVNDIGVCEIPLVNYDLDVEKIKASVTENTKILFICNPNNPTGTCVSREKIVHLCQQLHCLVIVDEAYADFMQDESVITEIKKYENLVVLRTLSKAYALAGARVGFAIASEYIISLIQKVKFPYNINSLTTHCVLEALKHSEPVKETIKILIHYRELLQEKLMHFEDVLEILPSQANFLCIRFADCDRIFLGLKKTGLIARRVNQGALLSDAIRISVGSESENKLLLETLNSLLKPIKEGESGK